jgi:uracil-DNA glycosylase family 4
VGPELCDSSSDWLLLGEAGGKDEAAAGLPFVGRSGRLLHEGLQQLPQQPLLIWNMVPRAIHKGNVHLLGRKTVTPTVREIEQCWNCWLSTLLKELHPRLIVAVGSTASNWLCEMGVERGHGSVFSSTKLEDTPVFVVRHPAGVLRDLPRLLPQLEADLTALEAVLNQTSRLDRTMYAFGETSIPVSGLASVIACDLETTSLDSSTGSILGIALCTEPGTATYISGSPDSSFWNVLFQNSKTVWFNGTGFDMEWVPDEYRYREVDDVMLLARVLGKPYGSLRDLAAYEYGIQHESIRLMLRRTGGSLTDNDDELAAKACEDVDLTLRLWNQFTVEAQSDGLWSVYLLERQLAPFIRRVQHNGMRIDTELGRAQLSQSLAEVAGAGAEVQRLAPQRRLHRIVTTTWKHLFGPLLQRWPGHGRPRMLHEWVEPVNPNSNQQLAEALLSSGVELHERTPSGDDYSLRGDILEQIAHPLAAAIRRFRKVAKIQQFVAALMEMGGVFYPRFKQMGAVSGRPSSGGTDDTEQ